MRSFLSLWLDYTNYRLDGCRKMEGFANMTTSAESGTELGSVPLSAL